MPSGTDAKVIFFHTSSRGFLKDLLIKHFEQKNKTRIFDWRKNSPVKLQPFLHTVFGRCSNFS